MGCATVDVFAGLNMKCRDDSWNILARTHSRRQSSMSSSNVGADPAAQDIAAWCAHSFFNGRGPGGRIGEIGCRSQLWGHCVEQRGVGECVAEREMSRDF